MVWPANACLGKLGLLLFCAGGVLTAQKVVSARAGLITYLQGPAFVDGKRVVLKTARFPQMRSGETLSTSRGRAELLLAPGVILRLAENSQVRMEDTLLSDTRVTLQRGEALIEVVQLPEGNRIQVGLAETSTELGRAGLYRFGISQNDTAKNTLRVYGGEALVRSGISSVSVKRGMAINLAPGLDTTKFDRKQTDSLHAWAARRSFDLFMSDPEARQKQTHWQFSGGYAENKNFGVEFRAVIRRVLPSPAIRPVPPAEIGPEATPAPGR
ncbi:MAG: FecR family protein [Acidobacteriia bacterium]|nr:FecR family protein [Terriglobia bacterium]